MVVDPSSTLNMIETGQLQPIVDILTPLLTKISIFVGGIFGLYLLFVLIKIHYERKRTKILEDIRFNTDQLNIHFNLPYSKHRLSFLKRVSKTIKTKIDRKKGEDEL